MPIDIPPLREHKEDIPDLVNLFLARFAAESGKKIEGITPALEDTDGISLAGKHSRTAENRGARGGAWPGPLLEARTFILIHEPAKAADFRARFLPEGMTLEQWEDEMIREALRRANGNKSQAARMLDYRATPCAIGSRKLALPTSRKKGMRNSFCVLVLKDSSAGAKTLTVPWKSGASSAALPSISDVGLQPQWRHWA